jgi:hypothetical protein
MTDHDLHSYAVNRHKLAKRVACVVAFLALTILAPRIASAEPITFSSNFTSLTTLAGGTVTFAGIITNTTGGTLNATDLFLNFSGFNPSVLTITQVLGTPNFVLPNNTFSATVNLFTVMVAPNAPPGIYSFDVSLQDINNNLSNSITFSVIVGPTAAVPEPATLLMLTTGLTGAWLARRKRRHKHR